MYSIYTLEVGSTLVSSDASVDTAGNHEKSVHMFNPDCLQVQQLEVLHWASKHLQANEKGMLTINNHTKNRIVMMEEENVISYRFLFEFLRQLCNLDVFTFRTRVWLHWHIPTKVQLQNLLLFRSMENDARFPDIYRELQDAISGAVNNHKSGRWSVIEIAS